MFLKGLYLHGLAPIVGILFFIKERSVEKELLCLFGLFLIGVLHVSLNFDIVGFARIFQFLGIILLFSCLLKTKITSN